MNIKKNVSSKGKINDEKLCNSVFLNFMKYYECNNILYFPIKKKKKDIFFTFIEEYTEHTNENINNISLGSCLACLPFFTGIDTERYYNRNKNNKDNKEEKKKEERYKDYTYFVEKNIKKKKKRYKL